MSENTQSDQEAREKEEAEQAALPYKWKQTLQDVDVIVPVPKGTRARDLEVVFKKKHLTVRMKGQPPIIEGELCKAIKVEECTWTLEDQKDIFIHLEKIDKQEWWKNIITTHPAINTTKIQLENSSYHNESKIPEDANLYTGGRDRLYAWDQVLSDLSIVSSPERIIENWGKVTKEISWGRRGQNSNIDDKIPKRLISVETLEVIECNNKETDTKNIRNKGYTAISHVWGIRTAAGDISTGAKYRESTPHEMKIKDIQKALKEIGESYFWIDTLCINQDDISEKEEEIPNMGIYYSKANHCVAHLGDLESHETLPKIYGVFKSYIEMGKEFNETLDHISYGLQDFRICMAATFLVNAISDTLWGKRIWTVQEALLNKSLLFIIPNMTELIDSSMIEHAIYLMKMRNILPLSGGYRPYGEQRVNEGHSNIPQIVIARRRYTLCLADVISLCKDRECKYKQDRIYGILGLLSYGNQVKVDYSDDYYGALMRLYNAALNNGDTSLMSFAGKSAPLPKYCMMMDIIDGQITAKSEIPFPCVLVNNGVEIISESFGTVVSSVEVRPSIKNLKPDDKLNFTIDALYNILDMFFESKISLAEAISAIGFVSRNSVPILQTLMIRRRVDKGDTNAIAEWKQLGCDIPLFYSREQVAVRQILALYGEESIQIALVVHEPSKTKQWISMASTEDINGAEILSIGTTVTEYTISERYRVGIVVKQEGMLNDNTPIMKRIGVTRLITEPDYGTFSMRKVVIGSLEHS